MFILANAFHQGYMYVDDMYVDNMYQVELAIVHKEVLVANILGGKLNPIQCWIAEGKFLLCQVLVHKECHSHGVN